MTCIHKVRWSVKRPEDCRFRLSVSHYKDRIVAPDEYTGATAVTPSDAEQVLATKDKTVRANITVNSAPVESLATSENGTFVPSSGNVGFSEVVVDVEPSLESLSVTENGLYLPESGTDGFDRVSVDVPIPTFSTEEKTVTENGVYLPSAGKDGISKVTVNVEETWDGSLVPDENDTGFFHCRVINLLSTDIIVIDGYGTGYRWVSIKSGQPAFAYWGQQFGTGDQNADYVHCRIYLVPTDDTSVVIGGPAWGADGSVTATNYSFKGEYLKYKVIHAS